MENIKIRYIIGNRMNGGIRHVIITIDMLENRHSASDYLQLQMNDYIIARNISSGLKDKNEDDIYEDDIIRYKGYDGKVYEQKCPSISSFHFWQETEDNDTVEVIGNIHFMNVKNQ